MTYHLWCSSNSWVDDSIHLHLFQRTLTSAAAKCYIELPRGAYQDLKSLAMAFLTHFWLRVWYETSTHLLTSLKQNTATHIFDHIHEWRRRHRLIKFDILNEILNEWFTKPSVNKILKGIAMGGCVTEEQTISCAQYLDLVYSQSGTLYDFLRDAPRPSTDLTYSKPIETPNFDGIIGLVAQTSSNASSSLRTKNLLQLLCLLLLWILPKILLKLSR